MQMEVRRARLPRTARNGGSGLRAIFGCLALLVAPVSAHAVTVYVDAANPAASNSNPGTEALPYRTISAAVSAARGPGNSVLVKPATYREQVTVQSGGAEGNPFVIRALGSGVVIDGADDRSDPASWSSVSGDVFLDASVNWKPLQVFLNGARLAASPVAPAELPANSYCYVSGAGLYVNAGGVNPGSQQLHVGRRAYGIRLSTKPWVEVRGFTVTRTEDRGIYISSGSNYCVIANNVVSFANKFGIGTSTSSNVTIEANVVSYCNDHGIQLSQMTAAMVRGNESFGNWRPNQRAANGIYLALTTNTTIAGNRLHDNQDTGLHFQDADNNFSLQNMSYLNGDHGYDHLSTSGVMHLGDIAYDNFKDGFSIEGISPGNTLMNCIAIQNGLTTDEFDLWVDQESHVGFVSDYNIFWNVSDRAPIRIEGTRYPTTAAYNAASGNDAHSIQLDPMFVSPMTGDFRLQAGSPAIDNANSAVAGWPASDAIGEVRLDDPSSANRGVGSLAFADRGALEFVPPDGATDHAPVVTAPAPITRDEGASVTMQVTAFDPDDDAITSLTANLSGLPTGHNAVFVPNPGNTSGTLSWTPSFTDARPIAYFVTFTAVNALSATASTSVLVTNLDRAPVVSAPTTKSGAENSPISVFVSASDPDSVDRIVSLDADFSSLPPSANVSFTTNSSRTSGTLTWTPTYSDSGGPYPVYFTAVNALTGRDTTLMSVINVNRVPVVTVPAAQTIGENAPLTFVVTAADPDGDAIASLVATGLPVGATFSADSGNASGRFSWTPSFNDGGGPYDVTFTAGNLLSGIATTSITVLNVDRTPIVTAPSSVNAFAGTPFTLTITAADPDGQTILSLSASLSGLPPGSGATFTPNGTNTQGTLTWTPGFGDVGNYTVNFSASNSSTGNAGTTFHVGAIDRAPVIDSPETVAGAEGRVVTVPVTVTDPDGDAISVLSATLTDLPAGHNAVFTPAPDNSGGTLTWTPQPGDFNGGSYTVTINAGNALSVSRTTTITVGRAPVVTAQVSQNVIEGNPLSFTVTASDPDGDAIAAFGATGLPPGATFVTNTMHSVGTFSWVPGFNAAPGPYAVTFTASNAFSSSIVTSIAVANVDRAPVVAAPVKVGILDGTLLTLDITASDPDGDVIASLTANLGSLPAGNDAVFTHNGTNTGGTLSWTPKPGDATGGPYSVTFTATNARTSSASTTLTGDRTPVVVVPATALIAENDLLTFTVTASDPDNEAIVSLSATGLPVGATFVTNSLHTSGTLSWTPGFAAAPGPYTVTFAATNGLTGTSSTVVTVENVDRAPIVTAPVSLAGTVGALMTFTVTVTEPDNEAITSLSATGMPAGATFTPNGSRSAGTFSWTPTLGNAAGSYTVTFTAGNALSSTATTTLIADRPPVVTVPAAQAVAENATLSFSVFASDPDAEPIVSLVATGLPVGATFTADPTQTSGSFSWMPGYGDAPGPYTVTFTAANALNGVSTTVITVQNVDRAPQGSTPPTVTLNENQPLSITVDVSDADGDAINSLTANLSALPVGHNAVFLTNPAKTQGTLTWTPTSNDGRGTPYAVTFTATNALNVTSTTAITVVDAIVNLVSNPSFESNTAGWNGYTGATVARVAGGQSGSFAMKVTAPASTAVFGANDSPNIVTNATAGARYRYSAWVRSVAGTGQIQLRVREYTALGVPAGSITLSPAVSLTPVWKYLTVDHIAAGNGNQLDLQVIDTPGASGEVFLLDNVVAFVSTSSAPPVVSVSSAFTTTENLLVVVNVVATDPDGDPISALSADLSGLPAGHNAVFTPNANQSAGTLSWTPTFGDAPGPYAVTFTAANTLSGSASTSIAVTNLDRSPVVTAPGTTTVAENSPVSFTVTASDPDGNAITSLAAANLPPGATFTTNGARTSGTFAWTPGFAAAPGPYAVTFLATNALSGAASTAVAVTDVDRAPIVTAPSSRTAFESSKLSFTIVAIDPDGNAITSLSAANLPAGATFTPNGTNTGGTLEWTPGPGYGSGPFTVTFTATNALSASTTTAITITEGDRPPVVTASATYNGTEGTPLNIAVTAVDPDGDTIASLIASGLPAGATFIPSGDNASGNLAWTPGFDDAGGPYSVTFTATNGLSGAASTSVTIANTDRAPVVVAPVATSGPENAQLTFTVTASDPDGEAIVTLAAANLPAGATFTPDGTQTSGTFAWTPDFDAAPGPYPVTFTATNVLSGAASASVTITNVDRAPVVSAPATSSGSEGAPLTFTVTAQDVDGEAITTLTASGLPAGATFISNAAHTSGTFAWTPGYDAAPGPYVVTFTTANALSASASTSVTVGNVDRAPVVTAPATVNSAEGTLVSFTVTANDPDGEALTALTAASLPAGATFTQDSTHTSGTFNWTPGYQDAGGPYTVTFMALNALSGAASTSVTIGNVDRAPVVTVAATAIVNEGAQILVTVTAADADGDSIASLTANLANLPAGHNAVFVANATRTGGTFTWTPAWSDGRAATYAVAFTAVNAMSGAAAIAITVNDAIVNLVSNPSFETNLTGWGQNGGATLTRIAGGYAGSYACQASGLNSTAAFGINDSPNVLNSTTVGTRYRYVARVRSVSSTGQTRIKLREYTAAGVQVGSVIYSLPVTLSSSWQQLSVDIVSSGTGRNVDFQVIDTPVANGETFVVDDVVVYVVPTPGAALASRQGQDENEPSADPTREPAALISALATVEFGATIGPNPARPSATLRLALTKAGAVRARLYDVRGRMVRTLADDSNLAPGRHVFAVDGRDDRGARLPAGMYYYRVEASEGVRSGSFVIVN